MSGDSADTNEKVINPMVDGEAATYQGKHKYAVQVMYSLNSHRNTEPKCGYWAFDNIPALAEMILRCCEEPGDSITIDFGESNKDYCTKLCWILKMESYVVAVDSEDKIVQIRKIKQIDDFEMINLIGKQLIHKDGLRRALITIAPSEGRPIVSSPDFVCASQIVCTAICMNPQNDAVISVQLGFPSQDGDQQIFDSIRQMFELEGLELIKQTKSGVMVSRP